MFIIVFLVFILFLRIVFMKLEDFLLYFLDNFIVLLIVV